MSLKTRQPQNYPPQRTTHVTIHQQGSSSQSNSFDDTDYISDSYEEAIDSESNLWDDGDDLLPSDSASTTHDAPPYPYPGAAPRRSHQRIVPVQHDWRGGHQSPGPAHAPHAPPPNMNRPEHYGGDPWGPAAGGRGYHAQHHQEPNRSFYNGGGRHHAQAYHGHGNPYGGYGGHGGHGGHNTMVPFGQQQYNNNPFGGPGGPPGGGFFNGDGRYDMMPYNQPYYGDPRQFSMPTHMQQYQMTAPVPAPTEHPGQSVAPVKEPAPDPEKERLEKELALIKAKEEQAAAAKAQEEKEAQIRKDAEDAFQRRMDDMKRAQEEAQKEIERARQEAERAARERIEAEKKAEEERQRQHEEAMRRAEESARLKFEADQKAAEEKRKQDEEDRQRAEEAARIRVEAAIKAEAEAKEAAEKKAAEEAERIKKIEEDAQRKAEADAAAKAAQEKADAEAAAAAKEAAEKEQEELKKKWQEEAKKEAEEAHQNLGDKAPIKFKDAVGRKFSFPYHLCHTWTGMEELIKQAFLQVDVLGPHVRQGHYDLKGPDGEIILPSVWDKVVQPDWSITMTMWPIEKSPPVGPPDPGMHHRHGPMPPNVPDPRMPHPHRRSQHGVPPPPPWMPGRRGTAAPPPNIEILNAAPSGKHKKHKKNDDAFLKFFAGGKPKKKSKK